MSMDETGMDETGGRMKFRIQVGYEVEADNAKEALRRVNVEGAYSVNVLRLATAADDPLIGQIMSPDAIIQDGVPF